MEMLTLARSFASLLLDSAAKGTALLLLAALAALLCRRSSAALRHSIWCLAMGGLLVLPVASWALPAWQIPILPPESLLPPVAEVAGLPMPVPEPVSLRTLPSRMESIPLFEPALPAKSPDQATVGSEGSVPLFVESMQAPAIVEPAAPPWTTIEWTLVLVSVGWSLGVALFGVLLLVGLWRTVQLRRTSLIVSDGVWPGMLVELRQRLGLSRSVELREHAQSVVPLTWGILRPVVLLPTLARAWEEPMQRAVLLHELAHVQRGDVACQVLGRLTCALYWFHPLAWFALRQLRQEREQACDDAVVQSGEKASDYAEQLLQVARLCCAPRGLSLGVAMAEGSSLERRVLSLFDSARSHGPLTRRGAITSFLIGGAIVAGLAPLEPTASQAEPNQPVAAAVVERLGVYERAFQATVNITTEREPAATSLIAQGMIRGMGSGIIVSADGHIVTANHVVEEAQKILVRLHDGIELPASVVSSNPAADLAVILVHSAKPLNVMPEQHQVLARVGDEVTAIGNASGHSQTLSRGIVSGLGRDVERSEEQKYSNLIQTDVATTPENSGGPLLNAQGEAIGINIAIRVGSSKIGFAIPINDARKVYVLSMLPKAPENSAQIRGQIINEDQLGVPNAEVLIVGGTDWNRSIEGHVIAQRITDAKGEFAIPIPESELQKKPWGQVWRRAPGYAAARGNSVQSLESLMEKPLTYGPLVKTDGLQLVVQDPAGKPQPGVRVEALSVRANQGIGYALPASWRDDNSGISDAEGKAHLPYIDPGSVDRLELSVVGHTAATQFGPNYFVNYRPQESAPHFIFQTVEFGVLEGKLVPAPGVTLPKGLKIPLKTLTGKVDVSGVHDVSVDDEGRFRVPDMPAGEISVLQFLDDEQPLRPWISERAYVKAGMTTQLEIPIVMGTRVSGRVQKSDTKLGVADYEFEVYYGPAITFRGSDLWLLKHPVKADADGNYELFLPPGPINLRLTRYVDGYNDATWWLPREKRGSLGPLHEIPAQADFELPPVELVKMLPIEGTLVDQNDKPLGGYDWSVYGYPEIPGEEERFVMNSMAGVQTDKEGRFEGSYPEPYPPVRWEVSHRVWKTKYEFDDIKFRVDVAQESPLILRVDTTKPISGNDRE